MSFVSLSLEKVPEMERIGRFTSNDFSCWGMEVHNLEIWTSSQPDIFLPRDKNSHRGVKDGGLVEAIELVWETAKKKKNMTGWSASPSMALPESVVIREQICSHVKEEPFNNELHRAGVKGRHWGAYAGKKGQTLEILKRLMSWQKTKLDYI